MILYHFTRSERVEQILIRGLLPAGDSHDVLGGAEVVWLTERADLTASAEEREVAHLRTGQNLRSWLYDSFEDRVTRLSIRIPPKSKRLKSYKPWLRKNRGVGMPDPDDSLLARLWRQQLDLFWNNPAVSDC